jgi:hypothetical protein
MNRKKAKPSIRTLNPWRPNRIVLFDDFASQFRVVPSDADRRDTFFSLNEVLTRDIAFLRLGRQGLSVRIPTRNWLAKSSNNTMRMSRKVNLKSPQKPSNWSQSIPRRSHYRPSIPNFLPCLFSA